MALPYPPTNPSAPIPNNPFFYPQTNFLQGEYGPFIVGSGLSVDQISGAISSTGGGSGVSSAIAGPGISVSGPTGDVTFSNTGVRQLAVAGGLSVNTSTGNVTVTLDPTGVTPGAYTFANITVDAQGRITAAANGGGGVTSVTGTAPIQVATVTTTPVISIDAATPAVGGVVFGCTDPVGFNYGLGDGILGSLTTGTLNVAIGTGSLASADTGTSNTAIGIGTLFSGTSVTQNVAVGQQVLFSNLTGQLNVGVGAQALQNTTGDANTALGNFAGNVLTSGNSNILIGNQSGGTGAGALNTGSNNVVIGNCVSVASSSGDCQLAVGVNTICWLTGTSTGSIKPGAGIIDCAASTGTAGQVLMSNGANAICWGAAGGASAATPTVAGIVKGFINATNTALGCNAAAVLAATALSNTAIGNCAGFALDDACCNTLVGTSAGCALNFGLGHTVIGTGAGAAITTGFYNVFVGAEAGASATQDRNVFIGACAGCAQTTGRSNVAIGDGVNVPITTGGCQLAIGYSSAFACWLTGNNTGAIKPGAGIIDCANSCGTVGQYLWTTGTNRIIWSASSPSDTRDKEVLGPVPTALPIVQQIEPITYRWKERESDVAQEEVIYGFSAQQLQEVDSILVDDSDQDHLRIHDRKIVPLLVKAIQELSAKVEALEAKIEANG